MTTLTKTTMKEDNQLLVLTHLSQLLDFVTGIGGFIVPLVLWLLKKDEIFGMDRHGKAILNFRISMFLYLLICIPLILLFGLGLLGIFIIAIFYLIFPISNALKVSNGLEPNYPFSIEFIK
jgi:uncharacterized Tic20 family protein